MKVLRKNLWTLFLLFVLASTFMFAAVLWQRADSIYQSYDERQSNLVVLVNNALHSLFVSQGMLLDLLGQQLLQDGSLIDRVHSVPILDAMLSVSDGIVLFALSKPDGTMIAVSSNLLQIARLPNLQDGEATGDSFRYALETDKLVLGRTYYLPTLEEWIIPVRKRITDHNGQVVGVMSAGLRLGKASHFFNQDIHSGIHHDVLLLRDRDYYLQYLSSEWMDQNIAFNRPVAASLLHQVLRDSGLTLEQAKSSASPVQYLNVVNRRQARTRGFALYNPEYELWVLSEIEQGFLHKQWLAIGIFYLPILLVIQFLAFLGFYHIHRTEIARHKELMFQATHDQLTRLPNRYYLAEQVQSWFAGQQRFAMLFVDMDNFKGVNDGFGHECGDRVLQEITARLQRVVGRQDLLARLGGDEFVVLTRNADTDSLLALARRLISIADTDFQVGHFSFSLGVSVGAACYPEHGRDFNSLMQAADIAMYEAKKHRNSVRVFVPAMQHNYLSKIQIEQRLRNAMNNHELYMMYQPKVDINGAVKGVEALVRWENSELGFVPPDQFIAVAEAAGLMPELGQFILQTVLQDMVQLQQTLQVEFPVAINISVKQFLREHFVRDVLHSIDAAGMARQQVILEITENVFIDDMDLVVDLLRVLHVAGVRLSMDDFGTGYSSLSALRRLPVDELKIDKSFIDNILGEDDARKMVQSIITIGHNYGMSLVAEGVETAEQAALLHEYGCECFQGYHFARPMRLADLQALIQATVLAG